jgi:MFS family permease
MIQGFFGSAILPCGTAITINAFKKEEQGKALGIYGSLVGIGIGFGPLIGGILDKALHWRWIFFINIPIVCLSLLICLPMLNESKLLKKVNVDWIGVFLLTATLGALTFTISENEFYGWISWPITVSTIISITCGFLLYKHEIKVKHPIIPPKLFKNKSFMLATLIYIGAVAFHWPVLFLMPIYLNKVIEYGPNAVSLILSSMTLMTIVSPVIAGYFYDKKNKIASIHLIFSLNVISLILFLILNENGPLWIILISFTLFGLAWGIGNGIATPIALLHSKNSENAGVISGALTTLLNIFAIFSLSLVTAFFQYGESKHFKEEIIQKIPPDIASSLNIKSIVDINRHSLEELPEKVISALLPIYKSSFIYGMNKAYFLILFATIICWVICAKLSRYVFIKTSES